MIYHRYLTNKYFPWLIGITFKQKTGPTAELKLSWSQKTV